MKFEISRRSQGSFSDVAPVEGAFIERRPRVDRRVVDDPSKLSFGNESITWYRCGTNHRVENGCIVRDMEMCSVWVVEIASLEELMDLGRRCAEAISLQGNVIEIIDQNW